MPVIVCARCSDAAERGAERGFCVTCAPSPEVAAQLARDAADRHRRSLRLAEVGAQRRRERRVVYVGEPETGPPPVSPPPDGTTWRTLSPRRLDASAHLFRPGMAASLCGRLLDVEATVPGRPGDRGCRLCARTAGMTVHMTTLVVVT